MILVKKYIHIYSLTLSITLHSTISGAFGYFEVTHDITKYCKADVFSEIGKRARVSVRFSTVGKEEVKGNSCGVLWHFMILFFFLHIQVGRVAVLTQCGTLVALL